MEIAQAKRPRAAIPDEEVGSKCICARHILCLCELCGRGLPFQVEYFMGAFGGAGATLAQDWQKAFCLGQVCYASLHTWPGSVCQQEKCRPGAKPCAEGTVTQPLDGHPSLCSLG